MYILLLLLWYISKVGVLTSASKSKSQSSKLTDVSHHKGELSFVSKLRLQLIYDLWESCHKICGIIFHSENSNIITYQRSRSNSFFAFKVTDSSRGLSRNVGEKFVKCSQVVREGFVEGSWKIREKFETNLQRIKVHGLFANFLRIIIFHEIFCVLFVKFSRIFRECFANASRMLRKCFANVLQIFREFFAIDHGVKSLEGSL